MKRFLAAAALAFLAFSPPALAQSWPERPVKFVIGFGAGGTADILMRKLQPSLTEKLGQPVIVENRPGASGVVAASEVSQASDGYTFGMVVSAHVNLAAMGSNQPFDALEDFKPVSLLGSSPLGMFVRTGLDITTFDDLVALAKEKPGSLKYAMPGIGLSHQFLAGLVALEADIDIVPIAYPGGAPAITDIVGNQVDMAFFTLPSIKGHVEERRMQPIALAALERSSQMDTIVTFAELGYPEIIMSEWFGIVGPSSTPDEVVEVLAAALSEAMREPEMLAWLEENAIDLGPETPAEFEEFQKVQFERLKSIAERAGITPEN